MESNNKDVDVESYPLKDINSVVLRRAEEEEHVVQISAAADSKTIRYRDEAELAHFGKRQQLKVSFHHFLGPKKRFFPALSLFSVLLFFLI